MADTDQSQTDPNTLALLQKSIQNQTSTTPAVDAPPPPTQDPGLAQASSQLTDTQKASDLRNTMTKVGWIKPPQVSTSPDPIGSSANAIQAMQTNMDNKKASDSDDSSAGSDDANRDSAKASANPNQPEIDRLRALLANRPSPLQTQINSRDADLAQAQKYRDQLNMIASMGKAGQQLVNGFTARAGVNNDDSVFNAVRGQGNQAVQDVKDADANKDQMLKRKQMMDMLDPSNPQAAVYRQLIKTNAAKNGIHLTDDQLNQMSISGLQPIESMVSKSADRQATIDATAANRAEASRLKELMINANMKKNDSGASDKLDKQFQAMGQDLDPSRARSGEMGKNQGRVNAAGRVETLLGQFPDGNLPSAQMTELATSVGSLLNSGSAATVEQLKSLLPNTAQGSAAGFQQWLTGNPTGKEQQQFVKMFGDTARREKETAQQQIADAQAQKANTTWASLKDKDPLRYKKMLLNRVQQGNNPAPPEAPDASAVPADKAPAVAAFMQANGITDQNQAIKMLKDSGRL